jgi:hypothetical protein
VLSKSVQNLVPAQGTTDELETGPSTADDGKKPEP